MPGAEVQISYGWTNIREQLKSSHTKAKPGKPEFLTLVPVASKIWLFLWNLGTMKSRLISRSKQYLRSTA